MWKETIITVLAAVLLTLSAIAFRRILAILNELLESKKAEAEASGNRAAAEAYGMAMSVLDSIAQVTVSRIEATQASAVRKAVRAGEKPFTDLTRCSEEAYRDILGQLSPYVLASLETCVGSTERLIRNKIEEVLPKVKGEYRALEDGGSSGLPWDADEKGNL